MSSLKRVLSALNVTDANPIINPLEVYSVNLFNSQLNGPDQYSRWIGSKIFSSVNQSSVNSKREFMDLFYSQEIENLSSIILESNVPDRHKRLFLELMSQYVQFESEKIVDRYLSASFLRNNPLMGLVDQFLDELRVDFLKNEKQGSEILVQGVEVLINFREFVKNSLNGMQIATYIPAINSLAHLYYTCVIQGEKLNDLMFDHLLESKYSTVIYRELRSEEGGIGNFFDFRYKIQAYNPDSRLDQKILISELLDVPLNDLESADNRLQNGDYSKLLTHEYAKGLRELPIHFELNRMIIPVRIRNNESNKFQDSSFLTLVRTGGLHTYGEHISDHAELINLQRLVKKTGATGGIIFLSGRLNEEFVRWIVGHSITDRGIAPDITVIYCMPIDGVMMYYPLRQASREINHKTFFPFHNSTPTTKLANLGFRQALRERNLFTILSEGSDIVTYWPKLTVAHSTAECTLHLSRFTPGNVSRVEKLVELGNTYFKPNKRESVYTLTEKELWEVVHAVHQEALSSCAPERAHALIQLSLEEIHNEALKWMRDVSLRSTKLRQNLRPSYVEELLQRSDYPSELRSSGIPLDPYHLVLDVIQSMLGKKPRTYLQLDRFIADSISFGRFLEGITDVRTVTIEMIDPLEPSYKNRVKTTCFPEDKLLSRSMMRIQYEQVNENSKRILELYQSLYKTPLNNFIVDIMREIKSLDLSGGEKKKAFQIEIDNNSISKNKKKEIRAAKFEYIDDEIKFKKIPYLIKLIDLISQQGEISHEQLDRVLIRLNLIQDEELVKLIYVVDATFTLVIGPELATGRNARWKERASHSELAKGLEIYSGGEVLLRRGHTTSSSFEMWKESILEKKSKQTWEIVEINNGSGHYRPSIDTVKLAKELFKIFVKRHIIECESYREFPIYDLSESGLAIRDSFAQGTDLSSIRDL